MPELDVRLHPELFNSPTPGGSVLTPHDFLKDFLLEASRARTGEDVFAQTMHLEPDSVSQTLLNAFRSAPNSPKRLYADWYAQMVMGQDLITASSIFPWLRRDLTRRYQAKQAEFQRFEDAGVEVLLTNPPRNLLEKIIPTINRNHIKGAGVGNRVFYHGGTNMFSEGVDAADFMVKFTGQLAGVLRQKFDELNRDRIKDDQAVKITSDTTLYIDAGVPGRSITQEATLTLVRNAQTSIKLVSAFIPDDRLANELANQAKLKNEVEVVISMPDLSLTPPITINQLLWVADAISRAQKGLNRHRYSLLLNEVRPVHAKLLIIDGKTAIFGSHNFSDRGVKSGTKEWSILTADSQLVSALVRTYRDFRLECLAGRLGAGESDKQDLEEKLSGLF